MNSSSPGGTSSEAVSVSRRAIRGSVWSAASVLASSVSFLVTLWVLARLLTPDDYGMVGILISYTLMINNVSELGLAAALIQKPDLSDVHTSTVFWTNLAVAVALCLLGILLAPLVGVFFRNPRIITAFTIISLSFILHSVGVVPRSLLSKSLAFRPIAISEIVSAGSLMVVASLLAILGAGVYSIVGGVLARTMCYSALLWILGRWRPRLLWDRSALSGMYRFGSAVMGASIVNNYNSNIGFLVVGRGLGSTALGYYTLAYQLMAYPRVALQPFIVRVAFPALSIVQQDDSAIRKMYCRMVSMLTLLNFPFMSLLLVLAPYLIRVFYGEKWTEAILPLQILCLGGAILNVAGTWIAVYQAKGRADIGLKQGLITAVLLTILVVVGSRFGMVGVAVATTLYAWLFVPIFQVWINRLISLRHVDFLQSVAPAAVGSAIAAFAAFSVQKVVTDVWHSPDLVTLILGALSGAVSYMGYLWLFHRKNLLELLRFVQSAFPGFGARLRTSRRVAVNRDSASGDSASGSHS